ncbi:hypothetical protein [Oryzisolibacter sp. LB2S]|uniref:hypothetical protein n=1 Tax=Alicycliphilus soli TaxID=3228789 RepID=UPI003459E46D
MKLNPFSKKSTTGYYERIKAECVEVKQQLEEAQAAADAAKADADAKAKYAFELEQRGNQHSISEPERRARLAASEAKNHADNLQRKASTLTGKFNDLRSIVEAPGKLEQHRAALIDLLRRRSSLQAEREQQVKLIAKIETRIGELEHRIAAETQSASEAMAADQGEFALPEALTKLDIELRVARTTRENLSSRVQALDSEMATLPGQIIDAERAFKHRQASVAQIELNEQLPHIYNALARASVAARIAGFRTSGEHKIEIEIPHEYLEAARAKLVAERPSA